MKITTITAKKKTNVTVEGYVKIYYPATYVLNELVEKGYEKYIGEKDYGSMIEYCKKTFTQGYRIVMI